MKSKIFIFEANKQVRELSQSPNVFAIVLKEIESPVGIKLHADFGKSNLACGFHSDRAFCLNVTKHTSIIPRLLEQVTLLASRINGFFLKTCLSVQNDRCDDRPIADIVSPTKSHERGFGGERLVFSLPLTTSLSLAHYLKNKKNE